MLYFIIIIIIIIINNIPKIFKNARNDLFRVCLFRIKYICIQQSELFRDIPRFIQNRALYYFPNFDVELSRKSFTLQLINVLLYYINEIDKSKRYYNLNIRRLITHVL